MTDTYENLETEAAATPASERSPGFPLTGRGERGYERAAVDAFLARARGAFEDAEGAAEQPLRAADVRRVAFPVVRHGYRIAAVDAALGRVEDAFAARERETAVNRQGAREWVDRARDEAQVLLDRLTRPKGERFARTSALRFGYRIDEVDLVADKLSAYFATGAPVSVEQVRAVAFRMQRRGYREEQVDAVLDAVVDVMLAVR